MQTVGFRHAGCLLCVTQSPSHTTEPGPPLSPCPVCSQDHLFSFPQSQVVLFQHQFAEATGPGEHHEAGLRGPRSSKPWACWHLPLLSRNVLQCPGTTRRATLRSTRHLPIKQYLILKKTFCPPANNPTTNEGNFHAEVPGCTEQ